MEIGYRRDSNCITWKHRQGFASDEFIASLLHQFRKTNFKGGARFSFLSGSELERSSEIWYNKQVGERVYSLIVTTFFCPGRRLTALRMLREWDGSVRC
ncbi:hypothetical protein M513_01469 [Trichuris suis]|uniref:Uncharacterized protein n=1 Tax=Trichuris suis TaxID=68888 RepID=A0A085MKQ3_9BILA|nr:hypothetical protein M513_01469 [Trichuris suis]